MSTLSLEVLFDQEVQQGVSSWAFLILYTDTWFRLRNTVRCNLEASSTVDRVGSFLGDGESPLSLSEKVLGPVRIVGYWQLPPVSLRFLHISNVTMLTGS